MDPLISGWFDIQSYHFYAIKRFAIIIFIIIFECINNAEWENLSKMRTTIHIYRILSSIKTGMKVKSIQNLNVTSYLIELKWP